VADNNSVTVGAHGNLDDEGNLTVAANASLVDSNSVTVGGTLTDDGGVSVTANASLAAKNQLMLDGTATFDDEGNLVVEGSATLSGQSSLKVGTTASLGDQGSLTVGASANLSGAGTVTVDGSGNLTVAGKMSIAATGTISDLASISINGNATVDNQGDLEVAGGGSLSVLDQGVLSVAGTVAVKDQSSLMVGAAAMLSDAGSVSVAAGGTLSDGGSVMVAAKATLSDLGTVSVTTGGSLADSGSVNVGTSASFSDLGSVSIDLRASLTDLGGVTVGVSGKLKIDGLVEIELGGTLKDLGTILLDATGILSDDDAITVAPGATLDDSGTLDEGTGGDLSVSGTLTVEPSAFLDDSGTVVIQPGATYQPHGTVTVESRSIFATFLANLPAVLENARTTAGTSIASLIQGHVSDSDPGAHQGVAVTGLTEAGAWQFSTNGKRWSTIANVSIDHALLLPSSDQIRYLPAANETGQFDLLFLAWDRTTGSAGQYVYVPATGGASSFSTLSDEVVVPVTHVHQAPAWTAATVPMTPVLPGTYTLTGASPPGDSVTNICGGAFFDPDGTVFSNGGIAIVGASATTSGTWQYSTDGGTTWTSFGTATTSFGMPSASNALLLSAGDLLRYVPKSGFTGTATLQARAWDGSQGTAAGATEGYAITATGGTTAFSGNLLTISCTVNTAPTLGAASGPTLAATSEGAASVVTVATLMKDAQVSDADLRAIQGIAVGGVGGTGEWPGVWQYSLDGKSWPSVPNVSETSALLLPGTASLRFLSAVQPDGSTLTAPATLTYRAWDQTAGMAGTLLAVTGTGGATPISGGEVTASLPVKFVHHAPTWMTPAASLTPVLPGSYSLTGASPAGDAVSNLCGGSFSDVDGTMINGGGVAIVGASATTNGTWQYSTDSGTTWSSFGSAKTTFSVPSSSNALLLSASDLLRFVPNAGFAGSARLQARAWDGSQGTAVVAGATKGYAITATGGTTAFSNNLLTISCAINSAPTLSAASGPTAPAVNEGSVVVVSASTLLKAAQVSDSDPRALQGIAIVGVGGTGQWPGVLQYSLDGKRWPAVPAVSEASALLLPASATLRFVSAVQADGSSLTAPATLTYRAWDQTAGAAGTLFAVTVTGGATSISGSEVTASVPVKFVHHAPTWTTTAATLTPVLPGSYSLTGANPPGNSVFGLFNGAFSDVDGNGVGVAVAAASGVTHGTWQYSSDGGTIWTSFGSAGTTFGVPSSGNTLLLSASDLVRFVPSAGFVGTASLQVYAWDGTQGTAALPGATRGYAIAARGGASAFSSTLLTATVLVNTGPVLSP
jgi:allophanate hydrolase subunit 1